MIAVFDIGGTAIKYGVIQPEDDSFRFLHREETDSNARELRGPGIEKKVMDLTAELIRDYEIDGIAISTAGMVDAENGVILYANENIPAYTGMVLKKDFEERFQIPCWVENDVNAAALGEFYYGAGCGSESMLMMTIGTGIGGAIVLQGEIYHGYSGSAGEVGYMWIDHRSFQEAASTTALVHNVEKRSGETGLNGKIIFERAKQGDRLCVEEIQSLCELIVKGICNCVCIINPQKVVLGGGIMAQQEYLQPIMKRYMELYMNEEMLRHTELAFAKLGNDAGMAGAYAYFLKKESRGHV